MAPEHGRAEQLMILLHGLGSNGQAMAPLAQQLRQAFPQALLVAPDGFDGFDGSGNGRQWFSMQGLTDANRAERVAAVLPRLGDLVRATQASTGLSQPATALVGFSQGAILALELAGLHDGLAGRVLAFSGRYAVLPEFAPSQTTLHLFHGADDAVIPVAHARATIGRLAELGGDATIDIAAGVGHEMAPALIGCALQRLRTHIPQRTWAEAMGATPRFAKSAGEADGHGADGH